MDEATRLALPAGVEEARAGLVTCQQCPTAASGVLFVTAENETWYVNLAVWNDFATLRLPAPRATASALDALIEERRHDR